MWATTADPMNARSFPWMSDNVDAPLNPKNEESTQKMKKWKCLSAAIFTPAMNHPEKCPVCGAPKSKFIDVSEPEAPKPEPAAAPASEDKAEAQPEIAEATPVAETSDDGPESPFKRFTLPHPVRHHDPIPRSSRSACTSPTVCCPFAFFSSSCRPCSISREWPVAATYNLGVVALAMPLVLFSGWGGLAEPFQRGRHAMFSSSRSPAGSSSV
jgi:hypothetical protein